MILDHGEFIPQICCSQFLLASHAIRTRFINHIIASGKKDASELEDWGLKKHGRSLGAVRVGE
jgi:hypothetical protein